MVDFALRQAGRFAFGLLGALAAAAAISVVPEAHGFGPYLEAWGLRLLSFLEFDFGKSALTGMAAAQEIAAHLPATLALVTAGGGVALIAGVLLSLLFATGAPRRVASLLLLLLAALPVFCAGLILAYGAAKWLAWPVSVNARMTEPASIFSADPKALQLTLPAVLTVGLAGAAAVQLALRRATAASAEQRFRTGLKRLGLSQIEIERFYVVPQVAAGLLASAGEIVRALLAAAVVAEWVFHRPGAADLFVKSVALRDWNMAALILFVFAAFSFLADLLGRLSAFALVGEAVP
jgi:ABC-type dipeptide/oligopeptide/nickel transport system permease component